MCRGLHADKPHPKKPKPIITTPPTPPNHPNTQVTFGAQLDYQLDKATQGMTIGGSFKPDAATRLSAKISSLALLVRLLRRWGCVGCPVCLVCRGRAGAWVGHAHLPTYIH